MGSAVFGCAKPLPLSLIFNAILPWYFLTEIDAAFAGLAQLRVGSLVIGNDAYFNSRTKQFGALTLRHGIPTIYQFREFAAAGGLMSYGSAIADTYRIVGTYVGRILKGEKPVDLPVQQATRIELILNMTTAKALGIDQMVAQQQVAENAMGVLIQSLLD